MNLIENQTIYWLINEENFTMNLWKNDYTIVTF